MNTALLSSAALIWAAVVVPALAQAPPVGSQPLTPERVFSEPGLVGVTARGVDISPDGRLLTYLQGETDNQNKLDLWAAPIVGGAPRLLVAGKSVEPDAAVLSEAEKGRRERQRVAALSGVIEYRWDEQGRSLLIPAAGDLYLVDEASGAVKKLATPAVGNTDARFSPTGKLISYVRDQNLFIFDPATGAEVRSPLAWRSSWPRKKCIASPAIGGRRRIGAWPTQRSMKAPSTSSPGWKSAPTAPAFMSSAIQRPGGPTRL
jgi:dipeptidyl-peptidase-4